MLSSKIFRERISEKGHTYSVLEDRCMPRIRDEYLDCVIYLYYSKEDAERGTVHENGGSGFLVGIPSAEGPPHVYAVSNRHIVEKSPVIRLNTKSGECDVLPVETSSWIFNRQHDIAVCHITLPSVYKYKFVSLEQFVTPAIIESERIGPGDDVFIVGRFVNHEGRQRNIPSVRFGNLAMMLDEPVRHKDSEDEGEVSFLVDIRTVSGYSGSPVFVLPRILDTTSVNILAVRAGGPSAWLLGVEWGHLLDHNGINTGMSCVSPVWFLKELLDDPRLVQARQEQEERARQATGSQFTVGWPSS